MPFVSTWTVDRKAVSTADATVEILRSRSKHKHEFRFDGESYLVALGIAGGRASGETMMDGLLSDHRAFPGCCVMVPAGTRMHGWSQPQSASFWINIYLTGAFALDGVERGVAGIVDRPAVFQNAAGVAALARCLERLDRIDADIRDVYARSTISLLMLELHLMKQDNPAPSHLLGRLDQRAIDALTRHVERNLATQLTVEDMAAVCGLSASGFLRAFARTFGTTPHRYIVKRRVARAKALLARAPMSLTSIALEAGFSSSSHFAAVFRRETGMSPSVFRRMA